MKRKSIHAGITGTFAPLIILGVTDTSFARALGMGLYSLFLALFVLLELSLRTGSNWHIPFATRAYKIMANPYELQNKTMLGGVFICLSGLLAVSFLNLYAALVGIMVLSFADSAASIVGKAFPSHPIPYNIRKHWEGTLAFAAVSFAVTAFVLAFIPVALPKKLAISLTVALVTALAESLPITYYYDNFTVPLSAALLIQLLVIA